MDGCGGLLRIRHHVVRKKMLPEFGVRGERSVADAAPCDPVAQPVRRSHELPAGRHARTLARGRPARWTRAPGVDRQHRQHHPGADHEVALLAGPAPREPARRPPPTPARPRPPPRRESGRNRPSRSAAATSSGSLGVPCPIPAAIDPFGTGKPGERKIEDAVQKVFDLTPAGIVRTLDLKRPIYRKTAAYGHFGRNSFAWEQTDKTKELQQAVS